MEGSIFCNKCKTNLSIEDFYVVKGKYVTPCKKCRKSLANEWRKNNPDKVKKIKKKYYKNNRESLLEKSKNFRDNPSNKEKIKGYLKNWAKHNRDRVAKATKKNTEKLKLEVFNTYGNKCNSCRCDNSTVLVIDHVSNNGNKERKRIKGAYTLYKKIKDSKFPREYQLLCRNCNWKKYLATIILNKDSKEYKLKVEVFQTYGNKCKKCNIDDTDVLNLDHVNNDGNLRKETGAKTYIRAKKDKYPNYYQLLCCNCNWEKHINFSKEKTKCT